TPMISEASVARVAMISVLTSAALVWGRENSLVRRSTAKPSPSNSAESARRPSGATAIVPTRSVRSTRTAFCPVNREKTDSATSRWRCAGMEAEEGKGLTAENVDELRTLDFVGSDGCVGVERHELDFGQRRHALRSGNAFQNRDVALRGSQFLTFLREDEGDKCLRGFSLLG